MSVQSTLLCSMWRRPLATRRINPALLVLLCLLAITAFLDPQFITGRGFMIFLRAAAPIAVLTCGQLFVLVSGGFDLSAGALVTMTVIAASLLTNGDPDATWWTVVLCYAIGFAVGLGNGLAVAFLRVPSIIATLGMLLAVRGAALAACGGAPRGYLPDNFRFFGRFLWRDVPVVEILPAAILVLVAAIALAAWLFHGTNFGRLLLAVGDNPRTCELAGVRVARIRIAAFTISALASVTAGIMLGGFAGVSTRVGEGLEVQAIAGAVIGGTQLLGGRGSVLGALAGALSLSMLFTLLNLFALPLPFRLAVQGFVVLAAAAVSVRSGR